MAGSARGRAVAVVEWKRLEVLLLCSGPAAQNRGRFNVFPDSEAASETPTQIRAVGPAAHRRVMAMTRGQTCCSLATATW